MSGRMSYLADDLKQKWLNLRLEVKEFCSARHLSA